MKRALILALLTPAVTLAQPARVLYQGFLTDSGGDPISATSSMVFKLYATETSTPALLSQDLGDVVIVDGSFAVEIDMDATDLSQSTLWMALAIGSSGNDLPRQRVTSVSWAYACGDTEALAGLPAAAYQSVVTGMCGADASIRQINGDGTVICEMDDVGMAGGVDTLTAGEGLLGSSTTGGVTLDLNVGPGLLLTDVVEVDFAGSGLLDEAARSDHDHGAAYVPAGGNLSCIFGDKVVGLDTTLGEVVCGSDNDTSYSAVGSLILDASNQFDLGPVVSIPGDFTAAGFMLSGPRTGYYAVHPSDFDPEDSGFADYFAPGQAAAYIELPGAVTVLAPLDLPHGATVTQLDAFYSRSEGTDVLACYLDSIEHATGVANSLVGLNATDSTGALLPASASGLSIVVDNATYSYAAECHLNDTAAVPNLFLYGFRVTYEYSEVLP